MLLRICLATLLRSELPDSAADSASVIDAAALLERVQAELQASRDGRAPLVHVAWPDLHVTRTMLVSISLVFDRWHAAATSTNGATTPLVRTKRTLTTESSSLRLVHSQSALARRTARR